MNDFNRQRLNVSALFILVAILFVVFFNQNKEFSASIFNIITPVTNQAAISPPVTVMAANKTPSRQTEKPLEQKTGFSKNKEETVKKIQPEKLPTTPRLLAQQGNVEQGQKLPALEINMSTQTFNWLLKTNRAVLLATTEKQIYKVTPDTYRGFKAIKSAIYTTYDGRQSSTRNIELTRNNPWGINIDAISQQLKPKISASNTNMPILYEFRLSNALDAIIIKTQVQKLKQHGITPDMEDFFQSSLVVNIEQTDNELYVY